MALKMVIAGPGSRPVVKAAPKGAYNPGSSSGTVLPPPPAKTAAPAKPPDYRALLAQAATQASTLAAAQIAAQIKAITDQQDALRANASAQAQQINQASLAAAQFLGNLGPRTQADYSAATNNLTGMAQGFTGGLRDDAQQTAAAAQAGLAGISGNTQQIQSRGPDLANLLYGVSGYIPANALQVQGLGAVAAANAIPAQTIGYGQSQAAGTLATGNQSADALNAQIAQIRATLPSTTQGYLSQFQTQVQNEITNAREDARDAATAARNQTNDYYSHLNTLSTIDARTTHAKDVAAAAKRAGRALTLREEAAQPHFSLANSRDGIMRDQYGTAMTSKPDRNGVRHYLLLPGYTWRNGAPTAPPKVMTQAERTAAAIRYSTYNHYKSDWQGNPILGPRDAAGHRSLQPQTGYQINPLDPTGHSVILTPKPAKPFIGKPTNLGGWTGYIGQDNKPHLFLQQDGSKIPWPKTGTPTLVNTGGWLSIWDPATQTITAAVDENGTRLIAGSLKYGVTKTLANGNLAVFNPLTHTFDDTGQKAYVKPTPTHFSGRYPGADGFYHVYNTTTGVEKTLTTRVPPKVMAQGTWSWHTDAKGRVYLLNSKTGERRLTKIVAHVPGSGAAGGQLTPNEKLTQLNKVSYQLATWTATQKARYTWDNADRTFRQVPGTGADVVIKVPKVGGGTQNITVPGNAGIPFNYQDALQWAKRSAPSDPTSQRKAIGWVNFYYPLGYAGHYMEGRAAIAHITSFLKIRQRRGDTIEAATRKAINTGYYDPATVPGIAARVFAPTTSPSGIAHSPAVATIPGGLFPDVPVPTG